MRVKVYFETTTQHVTDLDYAELAELAAADGTPIPSEEEIRRATVTLDKPLDPGDGLGSRLWDRSYEIDGGAAMVTEFKETEGQPTPRTLNHGRCVDWAELVCARVPGAVLAEWDDPQSELLHTFVVYGGRCYDAECLDGAADVTGLPIFTWRVEEGRVPDPS